MTATLITRNAGIFGGGSFAYGFLQVTSAAYSASFPIHAQSDASGTVINPATEESLAAVKTALQNPLAVTLSNPTVTANFGTLNGAATAALQASIATATIAALGQIHADLGGPLAITASALPLPTNAATEATLAAVKVALAGVLRTAPVQGAPTDRSVASTVAATSAPLLPANPARAKWVIQAPQTADLWISFGATPAAPNAVGSYRIAAGADRASAGAIETAAINYFCATAGLVIPAYEI